MQSNRLPFKEILAPVFLTRTGCICRTRLSDPEGSLPQVHLALPPPPAEVPLCGALPYLAYCVSIP